MNHNFDCCKVGGDEPCFCVDMNDGVAGTYVLSAGKSEKIQVTLNSFGHVEKCDDWEQMSGTPTASEPHKGDKAVFFEDKGLWGGFFANTKFFGKARKM